jgi:predicted ATPase
MLSSVTLTNFEVHARTEIETAPITVFIVVAA